MVEGEIKRHTLWFVLRLSICFLKTSVQMSLHRNMMTSRVSLNRGRSRENLGEKVVSPFCLWHFFCVHCHQAIERLYAICRLVVQPLSKQRVWG